jgi:hypothetical protein
VKAGVVGCEDQRDQGNESVLNAPEVLIDSL